MTGAVKPGVFQLIGDAKDFVFGNFDALKEQAKVIFPLLLLLELINALGHGSGIVWIQLVTAIPSLYLLACFALSWHRASLQGPQYGQNVNPFAPAREDWKFIGLFIGFVFVPLVAGVLYGALAGGVSAALQSKAVVTLIVIGGIILFIYVMITLLRLSFMLPARSVGVPLSMADAKRSSRGLLWKLIGSGFLVAMVFYIAVLIYMIIVGIIVGVAVGSATGTGLAGGLIQFFLTIPVFAGTFILTAMNVTILSRLYQWGIQNNY